jgi:DNA primase
VSDALDARLRAISAVAYVRALTGKTPDRAGKISCPFHSDSTPSLQLYPGGTFYCFGCRRGGTIYDFAAELWQIPPRGQGFIELRERLATTLDPRP